MKERKGIPETEGTETEGSKMVKQRERRKKIQGD